VEVPAGANDDVESRDPHGLVDLAEQVLARVPCVDDAAHPVREGRIDAASPQQVDPVAEVCGVGGAEEEEPTGSQDTSDLLQRPHRVVAQVLEDLGEDDTVIPAVLEGVRHPLEVPLDVPHAVVGEEALHPTFGAVRPLVRRDPDVDGRRLEPAVGERGDLVAGRGAELDEPRGRVEPLFEQADEERIPCLRFDVEAHGEPRQPLTRASAASNRSEGRITAVALVTSGR
jgi:hypothetical protein